MHAARENSYTRFHVRSEWISNAAYRVLEAPRFGVPSSESTTIRQKVLP